LPTEILVKSGTQIRFCVAGSLNPDTAATNWSSGTPVDVALTLNNLGNGAGRQSAKADLGATRAAAYALLGCVDFTGETPTVSTRVDYYWAPSTSGTAGTANVAGNSGTDAAAPNGALGSITLGEFISQCLYIGSLFIHDGASVQCGFVGILHPPTRYGQLIVVNNSGDNFEQDDVEAHQVLVPIIDEAA
jgi:hypothetical protein